MAEQTLFSGGLVFDGAGTLLEAHGVLVDGARIAAVSPASEFQGFTGKQIDTTGHTLLPGLIDCHVHLTLGAEGDPGSVLDKLTPGQITMRALKSAQVSLDGGITAVRDCGGKDFLEFAVRDACNRGEQRGPTIRAAGRIICMTGGHGNRYGRVADGVDEVVRAVREQVHAGCNLVKIMATGGVMTPGVDPQDAHYSAEEMAAGVHEAHRFHRTAASHAQGAVGVLSAVRGGVDSIEHGIFIDGRCIEEMLERNVYLVPTLSALAHMRAKRDRIPAYMTEKLDRIGDTHAHAIKAYYDAGGLLAMGTDAGTPFNHHGENAQEIGYMVDIGITPTDALTISTGNGAKLMRLSDRGRIARDMQADLLLVPGNPTQDISNVADHRNHRLIIKNGATIADRRAAA